jgi:molybdopterin-containing oxidoreductase family membrane subunit
MLPALPVVARAPDPAALARLARVTAVAALGCAALLAVLQLGRPWFVHWLLPLPGSRGLWPFARTPGTASAWAVAASLVLTAILLARGRRPGSRPEAPRGRTVELAAAAIAAAALLVLASNLAHSTVPGWHGMLSGLRFVAGALVAGVAAIAVLGALPGGSAAGVERLVAMLPNAALGFGALAALELPVAALIGDAHARFAAASRLSGPCAAGFWAAILAAVVAPQLLRLGRFRAAPRQSLALLVIAATGVWLERVVVLVGGQVRDLLPSTWSGWSPTGWDVALAAGDVGLFLALGALLARPRADGAAATPDGAA